MEKNSATRLEDRLIDFSLSVITVAQTLPSTKFGLWLEDQLCRSSTSSALNYGEARGAESRRDFIHKMKVCQKELRETYNALRIMRKFHELHQKPIKDIDPVLGENNELIAIFVTSIKTAEKANT